MLSTNDIRKQKAKLFHLFSSLQFVLMADTCMHTHTTNMNIFSTYNIFNFPQNHLQECFPVHALIPLSTIEGLCESTLQSFTVFHSSDVYGLSHIISVVNMKDRHYHAQDFCSMYVALCVQNVFLFLLTMLLGFD